MLISNKSNTLSALLYCILTIILLSCGTETTSSKNDIHGTVHPDGNGLAMTFSIPGYLTNALLGGHSLQAEATINGHTYALNVHPDSNEISGTIPDIPSGSPTLQVTYFIDTTQRIVLCTFLKNITVTAGQQSNVIIEDSDLDRNYDDDNDKYTNLEEIKMNTDPLDPDDYPIIPPGPPSNVFAIAGDKKVTLSWDSVTGASIYNIYMGTSSGVLKNNYDFSYTCGVTSCFIEGLTNGVLYYFVVTSENENGESNESAEVKATPQPCNNGDTRPCGSDIGECVSGSELCSNGQWSGICNGEVGPTEEVCDDLDNDCDGNIDNGVCLPKPGDSCGTDFIYDCNQNCPPGIWLGDGICDSDPTVADFTCIKNDYGDCGYYADNSNGIVYAPGLIWQQKDDNTTRTWEAAITYCEGLSLAGHSDWRLPDEFELMGIVDYGNFDPAIDTTYFPNTNSSDYWSSTTSANSSSDAWVAAFFAGDIGDDNKSSFSYYVRCVRGEQNNISSYTDNSDGTVTDNITGLMWQQEDDNTSRGWEAAVTYCESLSLANYSDWRLPNIKEIRSIVDNTTFSPAIDTTSFPNTNSSDYWSSTTSAISSTDAWVVQFYFGNVHSYDKSSFSNYVRCMR